MQVKVWKSRRTDKMKAVINIKFIKIAGQEVNPKLMKDNPKLLKVTTDTMSKLCEQIEKYFDDHKIVTEAEFIVIEKDEK